MTETDNILAKNRCASSAVIAKNPIAMAAFLE